MKKIIIGILVIVVIVLVVWGVKDSAETPENSPNSAENAPPGSIHNLPVPEAVKSARATLATSLDIEESEILILEAIETEWSDSCLGLGGPAESCLQVITPGYKILMQAGGKEYGYRTDMTGQAIRAEI